MKGQTLSKHVSHQAIGIASEIDIKEKYELSWKIKKDYSF